MANPLALYVPIKQDADSQAAAQQAGSTFVSAVKAGLDDSQIVHFALLSSIPNPSGEGTLAIMLHTSFDNSMDSYLKFFWNNPDTQAAFASLAALALQPPDPPVTDLTGFENFINENNLATDPSALYGAYTKSVKQINAPTA